MRILQVNWTDLMGQRFNGFDLHKHFRKLGHQSYQVVYTKKSEDPDVWELDHFKARDKIRAKCTQLEDRFSLQELLPPFAFPLPFDKRFTSMDIVHYHLIHTKILSLFALPLLTRMKPSVWTLHDPWAFTGRCIHPFDCERWKTGCGNCPYMDSLFTMREDHTALMWKIKKYVYALSRFHLIVGSQWMYERVKQSPLLSRFNVHLIPFGVDLDIYKPGDGQAAKKKLGVEPGRTVISFRAAAYALKGLDYVKDALRRLETDRPICLLTFNDKGLVDEFKGKFQIIELGWVDDPQLMADAYNATDLFLMPSLAESFGMMAMEAMAFGKPTISFADTAIAEVTQAPEGGVAVPYRDAAALAEAAKRLVENDGERLTLGAQARVIAEKRYSFAVHAEKVLALYRDILGAGEDKQKEDAHD